jgi:hypothetical protein
MISGVRRVKPVVFVMVRPRPPFSQNARWER